MIVEPKVREFICTTAHPQGCRENVERTDRICEKTEYYRRTKESPGNRGFHRIWTGKQDHSRFRMSCSYTWNHV